jgi:hypothetical protein
LPIHEDATIPSEKLQLQSPVLYLVHTTGWNKIRDISALKMELPDSSETSGIFVSTTEIIIRD